MNNEAKVFILNDETPSTSPNMAPRRVTIRMTTPRKEMEAFFSEESD